MDEFKDFIESNYVLVIGPVYGFEPLFETSTTSITLKYNKYLRLKYDLLAHIHQVAIGRAMIKLGYQSYGKTANKEHRTLYHHLIDPTERLYTFLNLVR